MRWDRAWLSSPWARSGPQKRANNWSGLLKKARPRSTWVMNWLTPRMWKGWDDACFFSDTSFVISNLQHSFRSQLQVFHLIFNYSIYKLWDMQHQPSQPFNRAHVSKHISTMEMGCRTPPQALTNPMWIMILNSGRYVFVFPRNRSIQNIVVSITST